MRNYWGALFSVFGFAAVALGAIGAHVWEPILISNKTTDRFETAMLYWMFHTLAGLAFCLAPTLKKSDRNKILTMFTLGIVLFSGSLLIGCFDLRIFWNYLTPLGGISFLGGWFLVFRSFIIQKEG